MSTEPTSFYETTDMLAAAKLAAQGFTPTVLFDEQRNRGVFRFASSSNLSEVRSRLAAGIQAENPVAVERHRQDLRARSSLLRGSTRGSS